MYSLSRVPLLSFSVWRLTNWLCLDKLEWGTDPKQDCVYCFCSHNLKIWGFFTNACFLVDLEIMKVTLIKEVTFKKLDLVCSVAQSCRTIRYPMDYSLLGSSVHGIFQARILEELAIFLSRRSFWQGSNPHLLNWQVDGFFTTEPLCDSSQYVQ